MEILKKLNTCIVQVQIFKNMNSCGVVAVGIVQLVAQCVRCNAKSIIKKLKYNQLDNSVTQLSNK